MKSFRQIMLAICVILIASAFAGCGADTDSPDERPALDKIEYTNLNDSVSQKLLEDMLSGAGVSGNRRTQNMTHMRCRMRGWQRTAIFRAITAG